jgi:hypothetical protein
MYPAQVVSLRILTVVGSLERYINLIPFCSADGAAKISMFDVFGNAVEVERVRTLSSEDGLTLPSFHIILANGTKFLYRNNIWNNQSVTFQ